MSGPSKQQRQHLIATLLERQPVASQARLVALLAEAGVQATQGTVSRDLEELGAVKIRVGGGETAYALPERAVTVAPQDHLRRVLGEWAVAVAWSGTVVVVRTPPGSAHVVGSALDRSGFAGIIGTVAGDDTVLVVADEGVGGRAVAVELARLAGLPDPAPGRTSTPLPASEPGGEPGSPPTDGRARERPEDGAESPAEDRGGRG